LAKIKIPYPPKTAYAIRHLLLVWAAALVLSGCGSIGLPVPAESKPALRVARVIEIGIVPSPPPVQGRDGGYSTWFDGRSVWVFGDTLFDKAISRSDRFHSNSWSWTKDHDAEDGIGPFEQTIGSDGLPLALLPFTDQERAFNEAHAVNSCKTPPCGVRWALWPGAVVTDPLNDRMLLFYEKIYVGADALDYTLFGSSVAVWKNPQETPRRLQFNPQHAHPTLMFDRNEPGFGDAAVVVGHRVYVYACHQQDRMMPCRVARVAWDHVFEKDHWETWTADGRWCRDLGQAQPLFNGNEILSVSYNPYLDCFVAVYSQPLSTAVMLRTAPQPEGPWSEPVKAFNAQRPVNQVGWVYDALEHPEYRQDNDPVLYITYSRQTGDSTFEIRLVAVQIERSADKRQ